MPNKMRSKCQNMFIWVNKQRNNKKNQLSICQFYARIRILQTECSFDCQTSFDLHVEPVENILKPIPKHQFNHPHAHTFKAAIPRRKSPSCFYCLWYVFKLLTFSGMIYGTAFRCHSHQNEIERKFQNHNNIHAEYTSKTEGFVLASEREREMLRMPPHELI